MKALVSKLAMMSVIGFLGIQMAAAETISGSQSKGSAGQNATLRCSPVTINATKKITGISGSNAGFWIVKGSTTIARYYKQNDSSAMGKVLSPGTYYVYPNLKNGQGQATVVVSIN